MKTPFYLRHVSTYIFIVFFVQIILTFTLFLMYLAEIPCSGHSIARLDLSLAAVMTTLYFVVYREWIYEGFGDVMNGLARTKKGGRS